MLAAEDGIDDAYAAVLSPVDRALLDSGRFDRDMKADRLESLGGGHYGWLDDGLATVAPWGFDLASIETPVLLVQGGQDLMVPAAHAYGMAEVLPNATLEFLPEEGHLTLGMAAGAGARLATAADSLTEGVHGPTGRCATSRRHR